ncbi:hypothetical protein PoB_001781900 [Plakobranchus ocellatus]|uniref:Uncharacterized protein n=1 Tax=Plakobranchus ocellatus TaxID=259542 RepID=A0AAV3ZBH4_9GAST|nr:hypothetical protein PoB_001781900 [Plakobranchus ocellatus]
MDACPEDLALCIKETVLRDLESVGNEADLYRLARSLYMINHVGLCKLVLNLSWTLCGCVDSTRESPVVNVQESLTRARIISGPERRAKD